MNFHSLTRRFRKADAGKLLLSMFFILLVFIPLLRMLVNITPESLHRVFYSHVILPAVANSLISSVASTLISLILAYIASMCIERTAMKFRAVFTVLFTLPMLIPSISHGMGLIILLGNNGVLTRLLHLSGNIYGMKGIICGAVLYSFPVAFLMLSDVLKYENGSPYEAAKALGIPTVRRFSAITLPYLRRPLISVIFAVFTMIITDYGVPLMVGGKCKTIASVMYEEVIGQLDFGKGAVYGAMLLIPAAAAFIFDALNRDRAGMSYTDLPPERTTRKSTLAFAYIFCISISLLILLPIAASCILAFAEKYPSDITPTLDNVFKAMELKADRYLLNSVIIALCVASVGVASSFVTAYFAARLKSGLSGFLHLAAITSAAVPGVVLGLSYILAFRGSFIYGTLAILIMVNTVHFFSSPYLMMYNSFSKLNENLEAVGSTLGIGRLRIIFGVIIPQSKGTLAEMFAYFFVNCMMTISAVSFLATTANKPVSLMINQFEAQSQLEEAAVVSLAILLVNLLMRGIIYLIKKKSAGFSAKKSAALSGQG